MKIYGHRFDELYRAFPWPFRMLIIVGSAFLLFIVIHLTILGTQHDRRLDPGPVEFKGAPAYSGYDPALAEGAGRVVMAFSNIQIIGNDMSGDYPMAPGVSLAAAGKDCAEWEYLPREGWLQPRQDTITAPDGQTTIAAGVWRYETPGLVYDPTDPDPARAWKLYAYKYMWTRDNNLIVARRYGVIVARTAADPAGKWSTEEWAFGAKPDYPPPPYQGLVEAELDSLDPSLANVTIYARPSVVDADGTLVMSLSAFTDGRTADRVVMIASDDHGKTWRYLGTPVTAEDAKKLGHATLGGATLVKKGGHIYFAAVFGDDKVAGLGTFLFPFADITKGLLKRDAKSGVPVLLGKVPRLSRAPTAIGGGYAAYADACAQHGMLTGEQSGLKQNFQIFRSLKQPDAAD
jgi:hypothetical protein